MALELIHFSSTLIQKQAVQELEACNDWTEEFGLTLTHQQAVELVQTRSLALQATGRIEFGGGVIHKIIKEFCDSPFLIAQSYAETLHELTELFYYYKNETLDLISDDDLIAFMHRSFDGICQGSLELLGGRELAQLAAQVRRKGGAVDLFGDTEGDDLAAEIGEEEEDEDGEH